MSSAWDIPYSPKFKVGDANKQVIFEAVGKALSQWEVLVADVTDIFAVITKGDRDWNYDPAVRAYGSITGAMQKADMLQQAAETLFHNFERELFVECDEHRAALRRLLREFGGWAGRRNDIAHGHVTETQLPDYLHDDQPIKSTYLLCPSHSASKKWPIDWEPAYQYRANEIAKIGDSFDELAERVRDYAERFEHWKLSAPNAA